MQIDGQGGDIWGVEGLGDLVRAGVHGAGCPCPSRAVEASLEPAQGTVTRHIRVGPVAPGLAEAQVVDLVARREEALCGGKGIVVDLFRLRAGRVRDG